MRLRILADWDLSKITTLYLLDWKLTNNTLHFFNDFFTQTQLKTSKTIPNFCSSYPCLEVVSVICHGHLAVCGWVNASVCVFTHTHTHTYTHTYVHVHTRQCPQTRDTPTRTQRSKNVRHEHKEARKECNDNGRHKGATDNTRVRKYLCGQGPDQQWSNNVVPRPHGKI